MYLPLPAPDTLLARARSVSALYMVFLTREYWVPGMDMWQLRQKVVS